MAIVKIAKETTLSIKVQTGINASGSPVYKTLHFGSVKPAALDADIFAVGQALSNMQTHAVYGISREDSADLMNQ